MRDQDWLQETTLLGDLLFCVCCVVGAVALILAPALMLLLILG